jgi:hypothetical protein
LTAVSDDACASPCRSIVSCREGTLLMTLMLERSQCGCRFV